MRRFFLSANEHSNAHLRKRERTLAIGEWTVTYNALKVSIFDTVDFPSYLPLLKLYGANVLIEGVAPRLPA